MEVMKFMKIIKIMKRNMVCGLYITMAGMTMTACGQMTGAEVSAEIHTGELPQAGAGEEHVSGSDTPTKTISLFQSPMYQILQKR